jgi:hypothetical protein
MERAGSILLSSLHRQILQSAYEEFQAARALDGTGASPSDIKKMLRYLSSSLRDCCAALSELLDKETVHQAALHELRMTIALAGSSPPDRKEIAGLRAQLETVSLNALKAAEKMPSAKRGPISKRWVGIFLEVADRIFTEAGGRKKLRLAFLKSVCAAAGHRLRASDETLKRQPDKTRRRQKGR